jgi:hypothetical protein
VKSIGCGDIVDKDFEDTARMFQGNFGVNFKIDFARVADQDKVTMREIGENGNDGISFGSAWDFNQTGQQASI